LNIHFGAARARVVSTPLTPEHQSTLADRVRSRDPAAEEELVDLFAGRIRCLACARTHDPEVARDLTQEVLLAVVSALRRGQLRNDERLAGFIYGIARNLINNHLRARGRGLREPPLREALRHPGFSDPVEDAEQLALVRRALFGLPQIDRRILLLTLAEGLKPGDIAIRVGLSPEVVRARKSRAIKKVMDRVNALSRS
jgi:RNA polymerase sigma-70 factor (ECF subfamily)